MIAIQSIDEELMRTTKEEDEEYQMRHLLDSSQGKGKARDYDGAVIRGNVHTAVPVVEDYAEVYNNDEGNMMINEEGETDENKSFSYPYDGSLSIMIVHICSFLAFVLVYGIDSISSNPLIGPPIQDIEEYGAKDPMKIKQGHEYWRIITAMFINVGFLDLFFTVCILYTFGRCLEKQWGCIKWLSFYILSGIGGNVYSSITQQTATSVGNGGCILGLLGAMHVDFVTSILLYPYQEHGTGSSSRSKKSFIFMNDEESCLTCALTMIGLFLGIITIAINEHFYPIVEDENDETTTRDYYLLNNKVSDDINTNVDYVGGKVGNHRTLTMRKDWSVLYGGMLTGIFCACIWNLSALNIPTITRYNASPVDKEVHIHHLTRTELFFRLTMLVVPPLILELIFTMMMK